MKIYLNEISDLETKLSFTQENPWVIQAVCRVDELSEDSVQPFKIRPVHAHFSIRKVDEVYVVSGKLDTFIELVCSRCATPYKHDCHPHFSALFCKDPVLAGIAHLQRSGTDSRKTGKPVGQNQGHARHAHQEDDDDGILSESKDLDITYLSHEYIELSDVLTEQLQLQVPFQPLCQENCKGICSRCGTDLNKGLCACGKISNKTPFSLLKDYKV